ncbi:hypothetical protein ACTHPF_13155 [Paenibacillus sp. SAF-054]|uniref:hypothetical protein n=1 Tax=Paenibacillus sp. SAF-054 TaxID=3436863 RepID=UPI003F7DC722
MKQIRSKAFLKFKDLIGQNNHYLITILIGLDGVKNKLVTKSDEFHTTWKPKDLDSTVNRSRHFAIKATMAWIVDGIDTYFSLCNRKPNLLQDEDFISQLSSADKSVYKKLYVFINNLKLTCPEVFLIDLVITWRNRLVHFLARTPINDELKNNLIQNKQYFIDNYQGLDISLTLENFDKNEVPKFKEITSFIRAAIKLVENIDRELLQKLDNERFYKEVLSEYLSDNFLHKLDKIWSEDQNSRERTLINIYRQYGIIFDPSDSEIIKYSNMTYSDAKQYFT